MKSPLPHAAATALAMLMAVGAAGAAGLPVASSPASEHRPILLAQADEVPAEEIEKPRRERAEKRREDRQEGREQRREDRGAEAGAEQEPASDRPRRQARPETADEPAAEAEPRPDRAEQRSARQAEDGADEATPAEAEAEAPRRPRRDPAESQQPAEEPRQEARPDAPEEPSAAQAPQEVEPDESADRPARRTREEVRERRERQRAERDRQRAEPAQEAPVETEASDPAREPERAADDAEQVEPAEAADDAEPRRNARQGAEDDGDEAAQQRRPRRDDPEDADEARAPNDGSAAPVLDSQKQERSERRDGREQTREERRRERDRSQPRREAGPPPRSDRDAQEALRPDRMESVTAERGERRDDDRGEPRRRERPSGSEVLREIGDRLIIEFGDQVIVESNDRPRMARGARDVFTEDLPRGRTRETIERRDGSRVVTVRNRYGDVIRRSRIMPDGQEVVLVYVEQRDFERVRDWRDPGLDLPPMQLDIPVEDYILDARQAQDSEAYYTFLDQPPVEAVERLYSVDEVKRSARIRDKTRRVDLDTLTFEFGSHSIPEDQIPRLEEVADAMARLLDENPAETFLIEGHTDAVGSDMANLALSDRRAEGVADALTDVFDIPPENLATQGYGEQYLKVRTEEPERENRRVAIRRITPLVAPVASAQ